jgi:hydrogenase maturation protease
MAMTFGRAQNGVALRLPPQSMTRQQFRMSMAKTDPSTGKSALLVIGYGNTLRGDDGVGTRVAEAVGALRLPGVRTLICQQLSPEHAEPLSQAHTVVFVDAAVDAPKEVQLRPLEPGETTQLMAHAADPRTMLALARDVFGHAPRAWWLTIPAVNLEFGEELTPAARRGLEAAVEKIQSLAAESGGRE